METVRRAAWALMGALQDCAPIVGAGVTMRPEVVLREQRPGGFQLAWVGAQGGGQQRVRLQGLWWEDAPARVVAGDLDAALASVRGGAKRVHAPLALLCRVRCELAPDAPAEYRASWLRAWLGRMQRVRARMRNGATVTLTPGSRFAEKFIQRGRCEQVAYVVGEQHVVTLDVLPRCAAALAKAPAPPPDEDLSDAVPGARTAAGRALHCRGGGVPQS